jgi:hypothetical protein
MSAWAKLTMALRSPISLTPIGLVIARAVKVFASGSRGHAGLTQLNFTQSG